MAFRNRHRRTAMPDRPAQGRLGLAVPRTGIRHGARQGRILKEVEIGPRPRQADMLMPESGGCRSPVHSPLVIGVRHGK